jgi:hypothetical protein
VPAGEHRREEELDHLILPDDHLVEFFQQAGFHHSEFLKELGRLLRGSGTGISGQRLHGSLRQDELQFLADRRCVSQTGLNVRGST